MTREELELTNKFLGESRVSPIQKSIYKYEKMYEYVCSKNPSDFIDTSLMKKELGFNWDSCYSCPLCESYLDLSKRDERGKPAPCINCPVYKKTGVNGCLDTPWEALRDSLIWGKALVEIKREIEFLKSLKG